VDENRKPDEWDRAETIEVIPEYGASYEDAILCNCELSPTAEIGVKRQKLLKPFAV
jgi:hypothetical protein